jgi:hypothetical protein
MDHISRKKDFLEVLFRKMDLNKLERIDAYEVFSLIFLITKGAIEKMWDSIVDSFGVEMKQKISLDELFYFLDSLFRGLGKVLILNN